MDEEKLTDISEICEKFNVTSRTLRFYEEEGLIESTRGSDGRRRKYSEEQLDRIQRIMTLRTIGVPVREIQEYLKGEVSLKEIVSLRRMEIEASITGKLREIHMLNDVLMELDRGDDIFSKGQNTGRNLRQKAETENKSQHEYKSLQCGIADLCTNLILTGNLDDLYKFFSRQMKEYMPPTAFGAIWRDSITGAGFYQSKDKPFANPDADNEVLQVLRFQKVNLQLRYVFIKDVVCGLWMNYTE